jgi:L-alanine-DL-glutamate epimerase-like enolase superfamily enzyme
MKITDIRTHPLFAPIKEPYWTAQELSQGPRAILTEVHTDEGIVGYSKIQGTPQKTICEYVDLFAGLIRGRDPLEVTALWEFMFGLTCPRRRVPYQEDGLPAPLPRGARPHTTAAIAAIDIALWDIKGKAAGMPVWKLLGGENKPILSYSTGGYFRAGRDMLAIVDEFTDFVDKGYKAVKCKMGFETMEDDLKRIAAVRKAIGPDIKLMLDMNACYDLRTCIEFGNRVAESDITWMEEPLHWYLQPPDYKRLAEAIPVKLAHGERELTRFTIRDFIDGGGVTFVQFDSTRHSGLTECLRIAQLCEQYGVYIVPHHASELHGHVALAFPNASFMLETHGDPERDPIWHHLYKERAQVKDSYVHMNDLPGLGIEFDWDFAKTIAA